MNRLDRHKKPKKPKVCLIFEKQKVELNKLIAELVNASNTQLKVKWSWGIVQSSNVLFNCPHFKNKNTICEACRIFAETRKNLADLVILGSRL